MADRRIRNVRHQGKSEEEKARRRNSGADRRRKRKSEEEKANRRNSGTDKISDKRRMISARRRTGRGGGQVKGAGGRTL